MYHTHMDKLLQMTSSQWISSDQRALCALIPAGESDRKELARRLLQRWHPDRNDDPRATDVFIKVQTLLASFAPIKKRAALRPSPLEIHDFKGALFRYVPLWTTSFVLGDLLVAKDSLAYQVQASHQALFDNAVAIVRGFSFPNPDMRKALAKLLPEMVGSPFGATGGLWVVKKPRDAIRLVDLFNHVGPLDPKHVAWIVSGLFNLLCYLEHQKIAHHDISLETVWIRPVSHEVLLLGGWFFAVPLGTPITVLPARTAALASSNLRSSKIASMGLDCELIKAVARELLGDKTGQRFSVDVPDPIRAFLSDSPLRNAIEDYRAWKKALEASFGPPAFVPMSISASEIYQEKYHG